MQKKEENQVLSALQFVYKFWDVHDLHANIATHAVWTLG